MDVIELVGGLDPFKNQGTFIFKKLMLIFVNDRISNFWISNFDY